MQYLFLNCAPGVRWNQNQPESIIDTLYREPLEKIAAPKEKDASRQLGLSFIFSYLNGPGSALTESLRRLLALSEKHDTPVFIVLDGQNWWGHRPDLWNWWDKGRTGYSPENRTNVEWTGWGLEHAVKIGWRNWGRQIRVLPAPNIAAPRFRDASREHLLRLGGILKEWGERLPPEKRYLFPGVKVGWEASIGINAFYYPGGNDYLDKDLAGDPKHGLDMKKDFAGGLVPLGYAALTAKRWTHGGPVTLADQERVTADYLAFLAATCRKAGFDRDEIFTHAGGQYAPWPLHYSHRTAINRDSVPGWSLYGTAPDAAGDLAVSLAAAKRDDWCAAEWLPHARTADEWAAAIERTLTFRRCHSLSVYNWEGIRGKPEAVEGIRRALFAQSAQ